MTAEGGAGFAQHEREAASLGPFRLGAKAARQPAHGTSYEATDPATRTAATVTVVPSDGDPGFVERFLADIELLAEAEHGALPRVLDRGGTEDGAWLATTPVTGASLREIIDAGGPLVAMRAVRLLGDVADALEAAHAAGLLHRRLDADAVVVRELPIERPVLWDFTLGRPPDSSLTADEPGYRSPEELRGEPATPSSDHYALACLLFEALSGNPPGEPGSSLPTGLEPVLVAGLAEDPAARPASARELLSEAARVLVSGESAPARRSAAAETATEGPAAAAPRPAPSPSPRPHRRNALLGALGISADRLGSSAGEASPPRPAKPTSTLAEQAQEDRRAARERRAHEQEARDREERERGLHEEEKPQAEAESEKRAARQREREATAAAPSAAPASFAEQSLEERRVARERRARERRAREQEARQRERGERILDEERERQVRERRQREETERQARAEREQRERELEQEHAEREREREASAAAAASAAPTAEHAAPEERTSTRPRAAKPSAPPEERPADSGRRRRPTLVASALVVIVAAGIVGFLAGQTGEEAAQPGNATASAGPLSVNVPESWDRGEEEPPSGPALREPVSAEEGGGRLAAGVVEPTGGVLYPRETAGRGLARPSDPDAVRLGGLEAWRFRGALRSGEGRSTLFLSPTTAGMVAVSCTAPASAGADFLPACERAAATLSIDEDVRPVALSSLRPYAARADRVLRRLASARRRDRRALRRAPLRRTQARVARRLVRSHRGAAEQLRREVPRAARRQVGDVVSALRGAAAGYAALARATTRTDRRRYRAASRAVRSAESAAARAAARL